MVAVAADWTAQAVEIFVLPGLARMANAPGFLVWHRAAVVLTGFLANALMARAFLGELIPPIRWAALAIIIVGVGLQAWSGR